MQQLKDIYGETADKTIIGNTANIIFLKSTDSSLIEELVKMSGTTHVVRQDSRTVTQNAGRIWRKTDDVISYQSSAKEEATIMYNDFAMIGPRNSIVLRAGDMPIWNKNQLILPMAFKAHQKPMGKQYTLQNVPTLSTAKDFNERKNIPDFMKMLDKRILQAIQVEAASKRLQAAYGYSDYDMTQLDPNLLSDDIMDIVNGSLNTVENVDAIVSEIMRNQLTTTGDVAENNPEFEKAVGDAEVVKRDRDLRCYLDNMLSETDLRDLVQNDSFVQGFAASIIALAKDDALSDTCGLTLSEDHTQIIFNGREMFRGEVAPSDSENVSEEGVGFWVFSDTKDTQRSGLFALLINNTDWDKAFGDGFVDTFKKYFDFSQFDDLRTS